MIAPSFLMTLPEWLVHSVAATGVLKRLSDIPRYRFYLLTSALAALLAAAIKRQSQSVWLRVRDYFQLSLNLAPTT